MSRSSRKRVLLVGGSLNQTSMMTRVADALAPDHDCFFAPFYADGLLRLAAERSLLDFTILAGQARRASLRHVAERGLPVDERGRSNDYHIAVMGTDLVVPANLRGKPIVLVQEGMTDPEDWRYRLVRTLGLPRFLANTSMTGLSHAYARFCVASEGYRELFVAKGVRPETLVVTGMPNFDDVERGRVNDFPHHGYVLAATSCLRETLKPEDRRGFIRKALRIADGRPLLFKLHPNEDRARATREIERETSQAQVFADGRTDHMVANCDVLVTRYSTVVFWAVVLGKEVHSDLDPQQLRRLAPLQNGGTSAQRIADVCRECLN